MSLENQFKNQQPIFYQILSKSFRDKKIPHAFLLVGKNSQFAANFIAKSLICDHDVLACNECQDCQRIERHTYGDFICVDGHNESIKKKQIEYIQSQFAKSSIEGKAKIYMLLNIENSTNEAMNSLLKLLEEPMPGIYAIFTCQNINRVLPTIQSRCQVIQLLPNSKKMLREQLEKNDLSKDDIAILSELFDSYDDCLALMETEKFEQLKLEVFHFIEDLYFHRENLIINVQTHLLKNFKDKDSIRLFLNMLVLGLRDLFHVKQSMELTYPSYRSLFEKVDETTEGIIKKIDLILNTEYLLSTNANVFLLMDSMMYKI